ncbi:type I-E CRISPR-associated protein Cse1/CasA [Streptomyces sp. NPDC047046]|uniref:type I-E CRISPR-associated protein Cse1/CasA n=1 Tax=Streptomyces sp. NPDC047046 TaxID=3155378 RepID=UPI0033E2A33E
MTDGPLRPLRWDPRTRPCVAAIDHGGAPAHYSLRALFERAEGLSAISASGPGEIVAVIEFLLALCFAAGVCPRTEEQWKDWVVDERDLGDVAMWLKDEQSDDDWDLFDAERPLGQSTFLRPDLERCGVGPAQLVIERAGDYAQFMDHRHLAHETPLPAAEAFRAMLTQHQFGLSGRARVSDNNHGRALTNLVAGRLQGRVRVVVLGKSLAETLRLNLYPVSGAVGRLNTTWKMSGKERRTFEARPAGREPDGPADLHSYLGRSILMRPTRGPRGDVVVDRVVIGSGEVLALDPELHFEDAVRYEKADGTTAWLTASPVRELWRDAYAVYGAVRKAGSGFWHRLGKLPYQRIGKNVPYRLWAVGMVANQALPLAWSDGNFPYAPGMEEKLYRASRRGSEIAEDLAKTLKMAALTAFEEVYPKFNPRDKDDLWARFDARRDFWQAAKESFAGLLDEAIDDDTHVADLLIDYATELCDKSRALLDNRLDALPDNNVSHRAAGKAVRTFERRMERRDAPVEFRGERAQEDDGTG